MVGSSLKRTARIVEKLCLDPSQKEALETLEAESLDASGMLDTVRGMFECATMEHAVEVMRALVALADEGKIALKRSKNRFSRPSAGGWMDCRVKFKLGSTGCVCEVQIVHQQLLTVRSELGAHHSYATYRSAGELLEWQEWGVCRAELGEAQRVVLETVLRMLRGEGRTGS